MLLEPLFKKQREVDQAIQENLSEIDIHSVDNVEKRMHAFYVELAEFSNEIGWFKYWKTSHKMDKTKTLEELADCMAFLLSVGLSRRYDFIDELNVSFFDRYYIGNLFEEIYNLGISSSGQWKTVFEMLVAIGTNLGFSTGEIEAAYYLKSDVNIQRQQDNY